MRGQLVAVHLGLAVGDLGVVAAGHDDDDVGLARPAPRSQLRCSECSPAKPEHVLAAGVLDQLRGPVPGRERRVQPLERGHRGRRAPRTASRTRSMRAEASWIRSTRRVLAVGGLGERADVAEHLAERVGVERDDPRVGGHLLGDRAHVVGRHRAHRAQRLGDDQVGLELAQQRAVELVDRLPGQRALAHGGVDLGRAQPGRAARRG